MDYPSWRQFEEVQEYITSELIKRKLLLHIWQQDPKLEVDTLGFMNREKTKVYHMFLSRRKEEMFGWGITNTNTGEEYINISIPYITYRDSISTFLEAIFPMES